MAAPSLVKFSGIPTLTQKNIDTFLEWYAFALDGANKAKNATDKAWYESASLVLEDVLKTLHSNPNAKPFIVEIAKPKKGFFMSKKMLFFIVVVILIDGRLVKKAKEVWNKDDYLVDNNSQFRTNIEKVTDKIHDVSETLADKVSAQTKILGDKTENLAEKAENVTDKVQDKVEPVVDKAAEKIEDEKRRFRR